MKFEKLVIGNIEAKLPIIQGGMGVGVSLCNLAGEVAKNGAIGVISAAHPGYMESDFHTNTLEANIRGLKKNIKKAKEVLGWEPTYTADIAIKETVDWYKHFYSELL